MADETGETPRHRTYFEEPVSALSETVRYVLATIVVLAFGAALAFCLGRDAPDQDAAEADNAVVVDLPAAEASSMPASDAADGPEQRAAEASTARQAPETLEPPKPIDEPKPAETAKPVEEPPPVVQPDPPAVLEREQAPPPPKPIAAPVTTAQEEHAPAGSLTPVKTDSDDGDEGRPPPSAHAITMWQKSLMRRLETAKRLVGDGPHAAGTVKVAFMIDAKGSLASERILQSSGSAALDKAALLLIRQAAPFPAPPGKMASRDTSFIVPVRFR